MKYISMDDIVDICQANITPLKANGQGVAVSALRRVIEAVKEYAVEAEPVKHGEWRVLGYTALYCTECNVGIPVTLVNGFSYCPYCGARMDGKELSE